MRPGPLGLAEEGAGELGVAVAVKGQGNLGTA